MNDPKDFSRADWEWCIDQYIVGYQHCKRDRELMKRRFLDGVLIEPLAEEFDMTVENAKRIVRRSKEKIFKHI